MLILDSRTRFTETAGLYRRYRPSYPSQVFDWIFQSANVPPGTQVVDLGCGTGIASRQMAARGMDVLGIDPNEEMLAVARADGSGVRYLRGEAADTRLPASSIGLVVCGQSFHWFDTLATMSELRRILVPHGFCAAFWNVRATGVPAMDEYEELLHSIGDYRSLPKPGDAIREIERSPQITSLRAIEFPHSQCLDRDGFFGRVSSSSYVVHGLYRRAEFDRALTELFERYAVDGEIELNYRTIVRMWQLRGRN